MKNPFFWSGIILSFIPGYFAWESLAAGDYTGMLLWSAASWGLVFVSGKVAK